MAKKNNDFFVEKKAWSVVKDELLGCYFMPYVSKILHTYRPLVYVDCFAGKGKFDDGNPGSPLIALEERYSFNSCAAFENKPDGILIFDPEEFPLTWEIDASSIASAFRPESLDKRRGSAFCLM